METTIHLKTTIEFSKNADKKHSDLIIQKFIECCINLDASIFEPFMIEDVVFQEMDKYSFLLSLKNTFNYYLEKVGQHYSVKMHHDICNGCSSGKPLVCFTIFCTKRNENFGSFSYIIYKENNILENIYRCWFYKRGLPNL